MQFFLKVRLRLHTLIKIIFFKFLTGISENDCFGACKCNQHYGTYSMTTKAMVKKQCKTQAYDTSETLGLELLINLTIGITI